MENTKFRRRPRQGRVTIEGGGAHGESGRGSEPEATAAAGQTRPEGRGSKLAGERRHGRASGGEGKLRGKGDPWPAVPFRSSLGRVAPTTAGVGRSAKIKYSSTTFFFEKKGRRGWQPTCGAALRQVDGRAARTRRRWRWRIGEKDPLLHLRPGGKASRRGFSAAGLGTSRRPNSALAQLPAANGASPSPHPHRHLKR